MKRSDTIVAGIVALLVGAGMAVSWADLAGPLSDIPTGIVAVMTWIFAWVRNLRLRRRWR